ncbi:MFS general substrate transporter [Macrolepiota fuliginosa MF-IS2]|uniref:MFS general substrate transporter n=1 Tax=Macrolepiota fuliginosa MF-IS2 TaxID=1400762 RepID=A0A9P5XDC7_9AGAR|nr:MFS general substrate transporter [Macrolepiota fuliginosa MF-IS2]
MSLVAHSPSFKYQDPFKAETTTPSPDLDIYTYHEKHAGRLVLDPDEAREEFGPDIASKLKLTKDGQKWSNAQKHLQLFIITLAALVPDFDSGIGIATVFALAEEFHTTTGHINNLTSNWSIFLIGWGGLFFVMLMRKYGRLPVLFWTQLLALGFLVGTAFAPNIRVFAGEFCLEFQPHPSLIQSDVGMRCLTGFFGTCPQVTGLYTIADIFPFHLQARKINIWTMGVILAPHLSPFVFGFLVARANWRWAFWIGCIYGLVVLILIVFFMKESLYHRRSGRNLTKEESSSNLKSRIWTLVGITGIKNVTREPTWKEVLVAPIDVAWRPHMFLILLFEETVFGFGIGINVTNTLFLQSHPPIGFGFNPTTVSGIYATPVIAVILGEIIGRYLNDWVMDLSIKRNHGVFEAESRLWTCYFGVVLYVIGFVILGVSLQDRLSIPVIIVGWAIAQVAVLVTTVAVYAYCNDCFPHKRGEISALLNLVRTLGGFSVAYYQVPWATKHGALQTLGCEAAIVAGLFILTVPFLQYKGRAIRARFS